MFACLGVCINNRCGSSSHVRGSGSIFFFSTRSQSIGDGVCFHRRSALRPPATRACWHLAAVQGCSQIGAHQNERERVMLRSRKGWLCRHSILSSIWSTFSALLSISSPTVSHVVAQLLARTAENVTALLRYMGGGEREVGLKLLRDF